MEFGSKNFHSAFLYVFDAVKSYQRIFGPSFEQRLNDLWSILHIIQMYYDSKEWSSLVKRSHRLAR